MKQFVFLLLACFLFFSCTASRLNNSNLYDLNEVDKSIKINLKLNDTIKILATTNPSTGYSWTVYNDGVCSVKLINRFKENINSEGIVGAPLREFFEFKANDLGNCTINFDYSRGWSKSIGMSKQIKFIVKP